MKFRLTIFQFFCTALLVCGALTNRVPAAAAADACPVGKTVNVVAHEDDDILFLNPDIQRDISLGKCVTTVYVTAGDDGLDSSYWLNRENGAKAAYALMNGALNFWTQSTVNITGHEAVVFTLTGAQNTSLVFLRLPDGNYDGTGFESTGFNNLQKLWQGSISSLDSVDNASSYTKNSLTLSLKALFDVYEPDIIRTQNYMDPYNSAVDHSDHYTAAYFTQAASQQFEMPHTLIGYYDYEIRYNAENLTEAESEAKSGTFLEYAQYDTHVCQTLGTCLGTKYGDWFFRMYPLSPTPTPTPSAAPTATTTPTPIVSPTPSPTPLPLINVAPQGTGYRWSRLTSATADVNRVAAPGINDNNTAVDVPLNGGPDDIANAYESAGIIFTEPQNAVARVEFINGSWEPSLNGVFTANLQLQTTTDGITWLNSGLTANPSYGYDNPSSSGKTYGFSGALPPNIIGVRIAGQVRTRSALSWYTNVREVLVQTTSGNTTPTPTPGATITPTPTPVQSVSPTPTATPMPTITPTPTPSLLVNIAPLGTAYRWSQMVSQTAATNQVAATGINDGTTSVDVRLNGGPDDIANAYEGAGVIFPSGQNNIVRVEFVNGSWEPSLNGAFTTNLQLQTSMDGVTWANTGITPSPSYNYDSSASSGKTYAFSGALPNNVRGVRITGRVRTASALSWYANVREVFIEAEGGSQTPTDTPTPVPSSTPSPTPPPTPSPTPSPMSSPTMSPTPSPTPNQTPTPTPSPTPPAGSVELLTGGVWTLSAGSGSAEANKGVPSNTVNGRTNITIVYNLHGYSFGSGDDEASVIFIQNGIWYAVNIISYGSNGLNGAQTITIPLSAFHRVGTPSALLDTTKTVSDLHARFWKSTAFTIELLSMSVQ